jgi:hypothetical protein
MQEIGAAAIAEDGAIVAPHCAMVIFSAAGDPDQASGRAGILTLGRRMASTNSKVAVWLLNESKITA